MSRRNLSSYLRGANQFSSDGSSQDELPDDLETARAIIESLTRQLKIHDDVTSNLVLLQKRIEHTHQRTQDAMRMLEDRLDNIEATWTKELEEQHKRWLEKYNRLMREAENSLPSNKVLSKSPTVTRSGENVKISTQQLESLNRRAKKIDEGIGELEKVASCTKNFDEKLRLDKQKIRDIDARLKALTKKEQTLNAELSKQMDIHFRKHFLQMTEGRSEKSLQGVCELIGGYKNTIENLEKALRTLEEIKNASAIKSIKSETQNAPSVEEIDEITILMRRFLAKLHVQLESVHLYGNPISNSQFGTGKHGSSTRATTTIGLSSNQRSDSDFGTTPLNTSHSAPTGSSSSSVNSQFMTSKSEIENEGTITAKEKSEQILNNKKK
ncbi:unnamed protein product [Litomosoides sigmodontis]|uniref:Uncharacterized protein n=1 Tax=Litomosoides sigmodontis TaxID=42156 RepID=A0A3P6S6L0_LITSI|nr:unnamed protein product [Litomosoides sigmodontis]